MLTVIGLGINKGDVSWRGVEAIKTATKVYLRTDKTVSSSIVKDMGIRYESMDDLYLSAENFDTLYQSIADRLLDAPDGSVYLVDGSGYEDNSVKILSTKTDITLIPSVSRASAISCSPNTSYTVRSVYDITSTSTIDPSITLVVTDIDNAYVAGELKLILLDRYGDDTPIYILSDQGIHSTTLTDLDRRPSYDYSTTLIVEGRDMLNRNRYTFDDLWEIMRKLRAPGGCPWDMAQTHASIRKNLIEEAYELAEGIDRMDEDMMREESGDVLLQAIFHAKIAEDVGEFSLYDMLSELCHKLITRHTHIFGDVVASNAEEALVAWENAKKVEKESKGSPLKNVPITLPALMRASKVIKYLDKIDGRSMSVEECRNLISSLAKEGDIPSLLMAIVRLARAHDIDAEEILVKYLDGVQNEDR